jgi:PAS domain S-box-containing protein
LPLDAPGQAALTAPILPSVKPALTRRSFSLRVYPALALVVLGVAGLLTLDARPGPPFGPLLLGLFALDILLADRLARAGRARAAAVATVSVLLGVALVGGLLYPTRAASAFAPLIAFAFLLPHLVGRQLHVAAVLAPIGAAAMALVTAAPELQADLWRHTDVALAAAGATAILVLILVRQRRANDLLLQQHATFVDDLLLGTFRATSDGRILDVNDTTIRLLGYPDRATLTGVSVRDVFAEPSPRSDLASSYEPNELVIGEVPFQRYDGSTLWMRHRTRLVTEPDGSTSFEGTLEDVTEERASQAMADQWVALVDSADDAIIGATLNGIVTAWNPGAERLYGWTAQEMIGKRLARIVPPSRRTQLHRVQQRVRSGERVRALETQRVTKDGRELIVSLTISPVHDRSGAVVGTSAVSRDVTEQRRLQSQLERWTRERAVIVEALKRLAPGTTLEATALAICREIATTGGFAQAAIIAFHGEDEFSTPALWADGHQVELSDLMHPAKAGELRAKARQGPWICEVDHAPWPVHRQLMRSLGVSDLAYVPIQFAGDLAGLLVAGTGSADRTELVERLPALVEFAAISAPILGPDLSGRIEAAARRSALLELIEGQAFSTVFQPVVDLATGAIVGNEALTRFASGASPDRVFAEAGAVGLGLELEAATLETALASSGPLQATGFLDLNVSPAMILAVEPLRTILSNWGWSVILEITEHERVTDYEALRAALRELGENVRLAVDDAGAGFASLKHIIELRPAFVKLDRGLVDGIDTDKARQGVVAGMRHLAESIDCQLVAEGVETEAERAVLLGLGIRLGQGYLFGRPRPASEAARASRAGRSERGLVALAGGRGRPPAVRRDRQGGTTAG